MTKGGEPGCGCRAQPLVRTSPFGRRFSPRSGRHLVDGSQRHIVVVLGCRVAPVCLERSMSQAPHGDLRGDPSRLWEDATFRRVDPHLMLVVCSAWRRPTEFPASLAKRPGSLFGFGGRIRAQLRERGPATTLYSNRAVPTATNQTDLAAYATGVRAAASVQPSCSRVPTNSNEQIMSRAPTMIPATPSHQGVFVA